MVTFVGARLIGPTP